VADHTLSRDRLPYGVTKAVPRSFEAILGLISFLTGRGGATASVTLRGISVYPTACFRAVWSVMWMISSIPRRKAALAA